MKRTNLFKTFLVLGAAAMLTACSGSDKPVSPKEADLQNTSDSISYFLGQITAGNTFRQKQMDTLLNTPERFDAYWDGFRRGMDILRRSDKPEDNAFNAGLLAGAQFAQTINVQMQQTPELKFNKQLFLQGFNYSYCGDSVRGLMEAGQDLNTAFEGMANRQLATDTKDMDKAIEDYAHMNGFTKNAAGQYMKIIKDGSDKVLAINDSIIVSATPRVVKGRDLTQYAMPATGVVLGKSLPLTYPFAKALVDVKGGSILELLMKPDEISPNWQELGLGRTQFIILRITVDYAGKE